jgi:CelD/BcsL family acetyltransferase involved in cellulose biosynthesis
MFHRATAMPRNTAMSASEHAAASPAYRVTRFGSFVEGFPEKWRDFVARKALTFDQTLPWFVAFERHLIEPGEKLCIVAIEEADGGSPVALVPLRTTRIPIVGAYQVEGIASLSNYYTAYFAPLIEPGSERDCARLLASEIGALANVVDLNPLGDSATLTEMEAEWSAARFTVQRYFRFGNWFLELKGRSSQDYLSSLPGQVRSTLKRKGSKLRARADASIRVITAPLDVNEGMDAYEAVYQSSWKVAEPHADFIRTIAHEFAARDWLRLGVVTVGGRPAASQLWFVYRGTASIFKLAYDEDFTDLSVGSILTMTLMQHVIDVDHVAVVDYLCGDDSYKRDWMSERRERIGVRATRRLSLAGLANAVALAAKSFRRS